MKSGARISKLPPDRIPAGENMETSAMPRRLSWQALLLPAFVLVAITLMSFLSVVGNQFIDFDDDLYVTANPYVQSGLTWQSISWAFRSTQINNWHPITWLSHIIDWQLFGPRPWGHHLISLIFHTMNAVLLLFILYRLSGSQWRSFFVAGFFAVHPLRVESVAWVAERKDVLSIFFGLLSIWAYANYVEASRPERRTAAPVDSKNGLQSQHARTFAHYALALLFFLFSLMSKPMLVTLPFLLLLLDYWPLNRLTKTPGSPSGVPRWLWDKIPFLMGSIALSWIAFVVQRAGGAMASLAQVSMSERLANAVVSYCRYLAKLFVPRDLAVFYPHPGHLPLATVLMCALLLSAITVLTLTFRKRVPYAFVGWFWFVGTLIPVAGLVQIGRQAMADRYTYFPTIGIVMVVVWGLCGLAHRWWKGRIVIIAAGTLALAACIGLTRHQAAYWKDSERLLGHAIAVTENNYLAQNNLGITYEHQGRPKEAISAFREAIRAKPDDAEAHINLGNSLCRAGQLDAGIAEFEQALKLRPDAVQAHHNLGLALFNRGRVDEGIRELEATLRLRPDAAEAHFELARALAYRGRKEEAIQHLEEFLRLRPDRLEAKQLLEALHGASRR